MKVVTKRYIFVAVLFASLALPSLSILAGAHVSNREVAVSWAKALHPEDIDQAIAVIGTYPVIYRKALLSVLAPERRSEVWRTHIVSYINRHPSLATNERATMESILEMITPELYSKPADESGQSKLRSLLTDAERFLTKREVSNLFSDLGPADGTFVSSEPLRFRITRLVREAFVVHADGNGWCGNQDCQCSLTWHWLGDCPVDPPSTGCHDWPGVPFATCNSTWFGCGPIGSQSCDGCCWTSGGPGGS